MQLNFYKLLKILNNNPLCMHNPDWTWKVKEIDKKEHTFMIYNDKAEFKMKYEEYFQVEYAKYLTQDDSELTLVMYAENLIDVLTDNE